MEHYYQNIQGWFDFENVYRNFIEKSSDGAKIVEVGSWMGKSSVFMAVEILNSKKNIELFCVDTWEGTLNSEHHAEIIKNIGGDLYSIFLKNIEPVKHIIIPIIKSSILASEDFADDSLDIVFLDAGHSLEDVTADINAWKPKIKKGGIIAGHDYGEPCGVKQAVDDLIGENNITIKGTAWIHNISC